MELAGETKNAEGAAKNPAAIIAENYDIDWNPGTAWHGTYKLGSAVHRQPRGDVKSMPNGWVDIEVVQSNPPRGPTMPRSSQLSRES